VQLAIAIGNTDSALWAPLSPFPAASIIGTTPTDTCSLLINNQTNYNLQCLLSHHSPENGRTGLLIAIAF